VGGSPGICGVSRSGNGVVRYVFHSHVSARPVTLSNNKVSTGVVIPRHIEVTTSVIVEFDIGKVVGPILNCIESALTLLKLWLRGSNSHTVESRNDSDNNYGEGKHDDGKSRQVESVVMSALVGSVECMSTEAFYSFSSTKMRFRIVVPINTSSYSHQLE
jgi:hypothetical protein